MISVVRPSASRSTACWTARSLSASRALVAEGGLYARLARLQFTDGLPEDGAVFAP